MIELIRYGSSPMGTFGELLVGNYRLFTVECPWLDNKPNISCVPAGFYDLEPHDSRNHPDTWALVNHSLGVYHFDDRSAQRTAILIHKGNTTNDIQGCIAPGLELSTLYKRWSVAKSEKAMNVLRRAIKNTGEQQLRIRWQTP